MELLLDTHVLLWWDETPDVLTDTARSAIKDSSNTIFVSAASIWEIAIKQKRGKLRLSGSAVEMIAKNGFLPLSISPEHAEKAGALPLLHADPFDRLLVAQAQIERLTLVTDDEKIRAYPVPQFPARG
jgi:PIN domain nuclease of toxin-antitoxin system